MMDLWPLNKSTTVSVQIIKLMRFSPKHWLLPFFSYEQNRIQAQEHSHTCQITSTGMPDNIQINPSSTDNSMDSKWTKWSLLYSDPKIECLDYYFIRIHAILCSFFILLSLASSHHCLPKENKYRENYEQTIVILKEIWNAKRAPNQCVLREIKSRFIFMKYSNKTK